MRILVTRPKEDAKRLTAKLAGQDIDVVSAPLLNIVYEDGASVQAANVQALLFTSVNGVRAFARRSEERSILALCVGDATAREAHAENFTDVHSANGDVNSLIELVKTTLDANDGDLLHSAGSHIAGALGKTLEQAGFHYRRDVLYTAHKADVLPDLARTALQDGVLDGVLFYSPRTGQAFVNLVKAAGLRQNLASVTAYCLSAAVAKTVDDLAWQDIKIAAQPHQDALLALL